MATTTLLAWASDRWPIVAVALLAACLVPLLERASRARALRRIPLVGGELGGEDKRRQAYLGGAKGLYAAGYQKFKDGLFRLTTSRKSPVVVVAPRFLTELQKLPDDVLSFSAAVDETMETKYTGIRPDVPIIPMTVKKELTPALARLNPTIASETRLALATELPPCADWTPVNMHHALLRIVAKVSGRVFIGPELCRDEAYLDAAIHYTTDIMAAQRAVHGLSPWRKRLLAGRLPQVRKVAERVAAADAFLRPVVAARKARKGKGLDDEEAPDDMLQWLINAEDRFGEQSVDEFAKVQLGLSFAAIHTTCIVATNAFYNMAALHTFIPELRDEIRTVLAAHDGLFTSAALQGMKKLDSFLKETLRFHPVSLASFQRKVLRPFVLSNGQVIPAGVTVEVPAHSISFDPAAFPDCDTFDPLRYYKLRQAAQAELESSASHTATAAANGLNQFVSVSQSSLTFGYGRHACPGRFFAANEIKMIVAETVLAYDIRNVDAVPAPGPEAREASEWQQRYANLEFAHMSIPDPSRMLLFKKVA